MEIPHKISDSTLWQRLVQCQEAAIACGALQRITTRQHLISDAGIPFVVRVAENLQRKTEDNQRYDGGKTDFNPFLPPEPALTVGAIGTAHLAVLNKFNVVEHHLLIVTRRFEPQEALLTLTDLEALCWSLREIDGLGFYNGGTHAGASQRHKHLQLIPLPLAEDLHGLPIEELFPARLPEAPTRLDALPFEHRIAALPPELFDTPARAACHCHALYLEMLQALGIPPITRDDTAFQSAPYNLLLTRRWLMVVPRRHEHFESISINAMGFAGSLFVRNKEELKRVEKAGPCRVLMSVSGVRGGTAGSGNALDE